jgi:Domain of unknown function (DUF4349)
LLAGLASLSACAGDGGGSAETAAPSAASDKFLMRAPAPGQGGYRAERIAIRRAELTLEVEDVAKAAAAAAQVAEARGGFAENQTVTDERTGWVSLRVPADRLDETLAALAALGHEKSRSVSSEDVTEQYLDLETRLRNARELRDRLRALLAKGATVTDLVAVETELARVQTEIESMDGQLTRLKGQVDLATVTVTLERKRILGPLGYVAKGIAWAVGKLFVIR